MNSFRPLRFVYILLGLVIVAVCSTTIVHGYSKYKQTKVRVKKLALNEQLQQSVPPASCIEWQTQDTPTYAYPPGRKCKVLGGKALCDRAGYTSLGCCDVTNAGITGALDIGPISGLTQVNHPITVSFRLRDLGSGDAIVYEFGKVDWGDNSPQQNIAIFAKTVSLTHSYPSSLKYIIHAMAGAQFKYSTPQVGGVSGSYEACQDNSIPVTVTP